MRQTQYLENILEGLNTLRSHKFRSFLTILGIIIGVWTVIVISSILTGMRQNIVSLVEDYGTENIYAFHFKTGFQGIPSREEMMRKPLKVEDAEAIRQRSRAIEGVAYQGFSLFQTTTARYRGESFSGAQLMGVSPNLAETVNAVASEGRFLAEVDNRHRRRVCVIGINVLESLFPNQRQIVGRKIEVAGNQFTIIGLLEKRTNTVFGNSDEDNVIYIPHRTLRELWPQHDNLMIIARAKSGRLAAALDEIEAILRVQRNVRFNEANNFDINTADRMVDQFDAITAGIGLVAIAISGVGLLVGGIGVMNIMLVSVTERTREIGVRKAVGAKARDIVIQFLFEAMTLTTLGGFIGIGLAVLTSIGILQLFPTVPADIPTWAVVTGFVVSMGVGLVFGVWPALKASQLDPIESLRYE